MLSSWQRERRRRRRREALCLGPIFGFALLTLLLLHARSATGGYAADFAKDGLLAKYRPELLDLPTTNGDHCTGAGTKMAMAVGANGIDLEKVQVHPTGLVDPNEPDAKVKFLAAEALRGVGGLLLNKEGDRFADELGHRDYGASLVLQAAAQWSSRRKES